MNVKQISRRSVRRSAHEHFRKGLSHQQVFETLAREFGFRGTADMVTLNRLAGWVEQIPGVTALKKERWRRLILIILLCLLAVTEALNALPVITMLGIQELPGRFLIPIAVVLFIYPLIYMILAVLAAGRSMLLYRWIVVIMLLALLKDIPAFSLYYHAEKLFFGMIVAVKVISLLFAWLIFRGLRTGINVQITTDAGTPEETGTGATGQAQEKKPEDDRNV